MLHVSKNVGNQLFLKKIGGDLFKDHRGLRLPITSSFIVKAKECGMITATENSQYYSKPNSLNPEFLTSEVGTYDGTIVVVIDGFELLWRLRSVAV